MDVLTNKSRKQYKYNSRYSSFPTYYNTLDDKYVYGITSWLKGDTSYVLHNVSQKDTLDSLALKYYGRPDLYWIIADFNRIIDTLDNLYEYHKTLKIPSLGSIEFE